MSHLHSGYLYKFCLTAIGCLISTIGLFSQNIKSVWFTESGQMVYKMCPERANYQINYIGTNCNKWEVESVVGISPTKQFVKFLNKTINNPNQVQQVVKIDSGFKVIKAIKFRKKDSNQTFVFDLNSKESPPVFVGYYCNNESTTQSRIWFSQNGNKVYSLCADKGLYQMNFEARESFNLISINFTEEEQLFEYIGPKRIIGNNKFQQDVRVKKLNSIIRMMSIARDSVDAHGHRYREIIQIGSTSGKETDGSFQPIFVGYYCN